MPKALALLEAVLFQSLSAILNGCNYYPALLIIGVIILEYDFER